MSLHFLRHTDHQQLFSAAARKFFEFAEMARLPKHVVALPGGRSIVPFLERVVATAKALSPDVWKSFEFFMVDERLVPIDHKDSNYLLVSTQLQPLISAGLITQKQLHPFKHVPTAADQGVGAYVEELKNCEGVFHSVFLGVGEDAHVAGLFPNHASVQSAEPFFITMADSPKPPPQRMSASASLISQAEWGMAFFLGKGKEDALKKFENSRLKTVDCPAKLLESVEDAYVVTDLMR